jgi:hypothetical protein
MSFPNEAAPSAAIIVELRNALRAPALWRRAFTGRRDHEQCAFRSPDRLA